MTKSKYAKHSLWVLSAWLLVATAMPGATSIRADDKPEKAGEGEAKKEAKPKVAVFRLKGSVSEAPAEESLFLGSGPSVSLKDLVSRIKKAGEDKEVKAIVLLHEGGSLGAAQVEEIRDTLGQVKTLGKDVYAHADSLSMREYVLLSGATRLSVVPTADLWITGFYAESPYLRGLLDKVGVTPDFLTCGAFKSASEIFMREGPSHEAEAMQNWLLDGMFEAAVKQIAQGRKVDHDQARRWINEGPYTAEKGKAAGLIDAVEQRQEFEAMLKSKYGEDTVFDKKYGQKIPPKVDMSSPFAFLKIWSELLGEGQKKKSTKDAVGIVYVEGAITLGGGQPSPFEAEAATSSKIRKALDEAARDSSIKAVVLRVNSPGGSAVASDIILDATKRVKAKKPFIVSMGDVAGSGGYYVACGSDLIFADESTITGSIGVVSGKLATGELWKKTGISFKSYQRGDNAGMLASSRAFSPAERKRLRARVDDIYGVFKGHVTKARGNRLKKPIDELAGGRVYTGKQALELGLVDKLATLQDAIAHVADEAKIKDYEVRAVPAAKNFLEQLVEESSGESDNQPGLRLMPGFSRLGSGTSILDLAMPYLKSLDPERMTSVKAALQRLELIRQEGVIIMMPEIAFPR